MHRVFRFIPIRASAPLLKATMAATALLLVLTTLQRTLLLGYDSTASRRARAHSTEDHMDAEAHPCLAGKNVFFLKTHKCASSTAQNILFRFGLKHNLSFAMPTNRAHTFYYPANFSLNFLLRNKHNEYNILCQHLRFDFPLVSSFMPVDAVYVSIVRNVLEAYESSIHFFTGGSENLADHIRKLKEGKKETQFSSRNLMLFDFGLDHDDNAERFQAAIRQRVAHFDLIMVADYFDESLILLKHLLCLDMSDIVYVKHNQRHKVFNMTDAEKKAVLEWNAGDAYLYDLANRTFWQRVERLGHDRMRREVNQLRRLRQQWESECVEGLAHMEDISDKGLQVAIDRVLGFKLHPDKVTNTSCRMLVTSEIPFTLQLWKRQTELFA